jgi:mRNA-degrading endonuclease toxin of MazEF toxin-antitoxin module
VKVNQRFGDTYRLHLQDQRGSQAGNQHRAVILMRETIRKILLIDCVSKLTAIDATAIVSVFVFV